MNKTELVERIAALADLTKTEAGCALDAFIEAVQGELAAGGKVSLMGFGKFEVKHQAAREGRNPSTGEPIQIPARAVPKFTAGKEFKTQVGGSN